MQRMARSLLSSALLHRNIADVVFAQTRCFAVASSQMTAIKSLRERTNAPISDVKAALVEAEWDLGEVHGHVDLSDSAPKYGSSQS